jgi:hypothetical protein
VPRHHQLFFGHRGKTEPEKRRTVEDWVIPNPVDTTLHPTMDLPGKRMNIQNEYSGLQLTEKLTQHGLDLNTLVSVIEAWDKSPSVHDTALSTEINRRNASRNWMMHVYVSEASRRQMRKR